MSRLDASARAIQVDDSEYLYLMGLGACEEIGRSCFLVRSHEFAILLDCGAQGSATPFPSVEEFIDPAEIDMLVLTHAHGDHIGFAPLLYARGFRGPVLCSAATREFSEVSWADPMVMKGYGPPEIMGLLEHWRCVEPGNVVRDGNLSLRFYRAGHILGALTVEIKYKGRRIVYSGDLGPESRTVDHFEYPEPRADALLIETTYGDRDRTDPNAEAEAIVRKCEETHARGGVVLIPAFSIGRSQEVLSIIKEAQATGRLTDAEVYVDGQIRKMIPVYVRHRSGMEFLEEFEYVEERRPLIRQLAARSMRAESGECGTHPPAIVVTTAGMCVGPAEGWIAGLAPNPENTIILVSYQAKGTPGRQVLDGTYTPIDRRTQEPIPFRMEMVRHSLSAHIDATEQDEYIAKARAKKVLLIHGDPGTLEKAETRCRTKGVEAEVLRPHEPYVFFGSPVVQRRTVRRPATAVPVSLRKRWGLGGSTWRAPAGPCQPSIHHRQPVRVHRPPSRLPASAFHTRLPITKANTRPLRIERPTEMHYRRPRKDRWDGQLRDWHGRYRGYIKDGRIHDSFGRSVGFVTRKGQMRNWFGRGTGEIRRNRFSPNPRVCAGWPRRSVGVVDRTWRH